MNLCVINIMSCNSSTEQNRCVMDSFHFFFFVPCCVAHECRTWVSAAASCDGDVMWFLFWTGKWRKASSGIVGVDEVARSAISGIWRGKGTAGSKISGVAKGMTKMMKNKSQNRIIVISGLFVRRLLKFLLSWSELRIRYSELSWVVADWNQFILSIYSRTIETCVQVILIPSSVGHLWVIMSYTELYWVRVGGNSITGRCSCSGLGVWNPVALSHVICEVSLMTLTVSMGIRNFFHGYKLLIGKLVK